MLMVDYSIQIGTETHSPKTENYSKKSIRISTYYKEFDLLDV